MRWLALLAALVPGAALALSCAPPNPAQELDAAFADGREPRVLIGRLTPPSGAAEGWRFDGALLGHGIRLGNISTGLDVAASCAGQWCAELPDRPVEGLFVAGQTPDGLSLVIGPCGRGRYAPPGGAERRALERCLAERGCSAAEIGAFAQP